MNWNQGECLSIFTFLAEFLETCLMGANDDLISIAFYIQTVYGKKLLKMTIVHCAMGKLENHQVLSFQSGFRDLKNDRIWCCIFFQTEQTVNRKKSGFRASLTSKAMKSSPLLGPFCGSEFWGFSLLEI